MQSLFVVDWQFIGLWFCQSLLKSLEYFQHYSCCAPWPAPAEALYAGSGFWSSRRCCPWNAVYFANPQWLTWRSSSFFNGIVTFWLDRYPAAGGGSIHQNDTQQSILLLGTRRRKVSSVLATESQMSKVQINAAHVISGLCSPKLFHSHGSWSETLTSVLEKVPALLLQFLLSAHASVGFIVLLHSTCCFQRNSWLWQGWKWTIASSGNCHNW
jgi:hypothetical protein